MACMTMGAGVRPVNPMQTPSPVFVIQEGDGAAHLYHQDCVIYDVNAAGDLTMKRVCSVCDGVSTVLIYYADDLTEPDRFLANHGISAPQIEPV